MISQGAALEVIARALGGHRSGSQWMAHCPAHDDGDPSLAIREHDGRVLAHCHAGCSQRDVIDALRALGLWECPSNGRAERSIVAVYDYTDERGQMLYQVVRFVPKDFRPRYPNGRGGWTWRKHSRQVLYRLPEVLEAPIVFVVEGEKDVETLREHGFCATTNAGGAKAAWLESYTEALRCRDVIIVPDNDGPGWERARRIAQALLGQAKRIRVFDEVPRSGAKDISAWFEGGHSEAALIAMLEGVHAV